MFAFFPKRMLIDDDSLLLVIQVFVNEFLIFGLQILGPLDGLVDFLVKIFYHCIGLLGPIDASSNLMSRIHILNLMSRIHILNLMSSIHISINLMLSIFIYFQNQSLLQDVRILG